MPKLPPRIAHAWLDSLFSGVVDFDRNWPKGAVPKDEGFILTDASGAETIDITQENGRQTRNLRMQLLTLNYAHNNEIYGSMVVYLRMKNIVPPASEPRPQQKK